MKKKLLSLLLLVMGAMGVNAQSVVNLNLKQNPIFGVSTNEVSAVIEGTGINIGADVVITGGSGHYTYRWYNANGDLDTRATLFVNKAGDYYLDVKDECDCKQTVVFHITGTAGVDNVLVKSLKVFPNPTEGPVNIESPKAISQVLVFSANGTLLRVFNEDAVSQIDLSSLNAGHYVLQLVTNDGKLLTSKVIKK